jgi:hypothetical protein
MKTGPDALGISGNDSASLKHEIRSRHLRYHPETSPGTQNMKTGADALDSDKNESGRAKHENGTRRPRYRRK